MSASAHIKMVFQKVGPNYQIIRLKPSEILEALIAHGWRLQLSIADHGHAWTSPRSEQTEAPADELLTTIRRWQLDYNVIGTYIWWQGEEIGGSLHIYQREQEMSHGMQVRSRWKTVGNYEGYTDDAWYLPKFIEPLETLGAGIAEVTSWWHW